MQETESDFLPHLKRLSEEGEDLSFQKGQVLFYEGHTPYGLYLLVKGKVDFTRGGQPCHEKHFCKTAAGEVIGWEPFFNQVSSNCTCSAITDCQVVFISKSQLLPFLKS